MLEIDVDISDQASPALRELIRTLDGQERAELNAVGARAANTAAIDYHQDFNERGGLSIFFCPSTKEPLINRQAYLISLDSGA